MARAPLADPQGLPRPGGTQLAFHRHAHPAAQLCGSGAAHVHGGGHLSGRFQPAVGHILRDDEFGQTVVLQLLFHKEPRFHPSHLPAGG